MTTPTQLAAFIAKQQEVEIEKIQEEGFFGQIESLDRLELEVELEKEFQLIFDSGNGVRPDSTIQSLTTIINSKTH